MKVMVRAGVRLPTNTEPRDFEVHTEIGLVLPVYSQKTLSWRMTSDGFKFDVGIHEEVTHWLDEEGQ